MDLNTLFLFGLIPAALLILAGRWINSRDYPAPVRQRYQLILALAAALILLGLIGVAAWLTPEGDNRPLFPVAPFLAPALLAAVALVLLNLKGVTGAQAWQIGLLFVLGLAVIGLVLGLYGEQSGIVSIALIGALVLSAAWLLGRVSDGLAVVLSLLALLSLIWLNRLIAASPSVVYPSWFQVFRPVMGFALPGIVVTLAAVLVISGMKQLPFRPAEAPGSGGKSWLPALLRFGLAALLVAGLAYTILWASIWDQTSDGLAGIWFTMQASLVAIGAGVLITFVLRGRQALAAAVFLLGVPLILILSFSWGWKISNVQVTAGRAARIQRAVERFYAREHWYPASLGELTPQDLLWIPGPVILQGEGWCYQGGADFYRLGTFYRDFFSLPLSLRIYAQAGTPPETGWECADRLAEMKARYDPPPFPDEEPP